MMFSPSAVAKTREGPSYVKQLAAKGIPKS